MRARKAIDHTVEARHGRPLRGCRDANIMNSGCQHKSRTSLWSSPKLIPFVFGRYLENGRWEVKPSLRACAPRAECRPTLQIVVYPDASQREWLHAVAAARKSPSTSSCVSIDNTLPTARSTVLYRCRFTGHSSSIEHSRTMDGRPAGLFFPPTRLEEVWRWV